MKAKYLAMLCLFQAAKTSQDGKCKFFTKEVNSMLLE